MRRPGAGDAFASIRASAHLLHALFLGLQLGVASQHGREVMGDWMFRLFRRQHREKFLSSFEKLGLTGLPHAVACARYHVLSNTMGGVGVEYAYESDRKAWVRFRYPRWMYQGATICGVPVEVSRGFLRGWYAQNGVSLGNPRLGFVCISEDMTGEFGLTGYFREFEQPLGEDQRLQFARDELPPRFDPDRQPRPPAERWDAARLAKASRNYVLEYLRNGLAELAAVIGFDAARSIGMHCARLIGLQYFAETAAMMGCDEDDLAGYLGALLEGLGDGARISHGGEAVVVEQTGLRIARGLEGEERALMLACWEALLRGAASAGRDLAWLEMSERDDGLRWSIRPVRARSDLLRT